MVSANNECGLAEAVDPTAQMEVVVSNLLRFGVLASFVIVAIGVVIFFIVARDGTNAPGLPSTMTSVVENEGILRSPTDIFEGLGRGDPNAVIVLGLLVLIATPILRVAISAVIFFLQRDRLYVAITLFVLGVLAFSFIIGSTG
jgi:uncharacterized membrane protein